MKKFLFIIVMMLSFGVNVNAQEWYINEIQADELKGTKAGKNAMFINKDCDVICDIYGDEFLISVSIDKGIFDYEVINNEISIKVLVGYYVDNKLIDKDIIEFSKLFNKTAILYQNENYYTKIVNHLKTKGNIRFVIERYCDIDIDITLPMNKDLPMHKSLK